MVKLYYSLKDELLRSRCFPIICTVPIFTVYNVCILIYFIPICFQIMSVQYTSSLPRSRCFQIMSVQYQLTVVTVSSESAREKEGEH